MAGTREEKYTEQICPKTGRRIGNLVKRRWAFWIFPVAGLFSLVWFLLRVIPKPSRASYPCQQVVMPLASGFVLWIAGVLTSLVAYRQALKLMIQSRYILAAACLLIAAVLGIASFVSVPERPAMAYTAEPHAPIGVAKGINPGRVVWVRDPAATPWLGPGNGHLWEPSQTRQTVVDRMMSNAIQELSGKRSDDKAWDSIFKYFNSTHGHGNRGYKQGEKIVIKVNLVGCIIGNAGGVDPSSYDLVKGLDYMNTSPQLMAALLRQLVKVVKVKQSDIAIGDPLTKFPNQYYDILHSQFPEVHYMDHDGGIAGHPRTRVQPSTVPFYWSSRPTGMTQDFVPDVYVEAKYFINMANLKAHTLAGVTLCAKNHFGSMMRTPPQKGYYNMHDTLARPRPAMGQYRDLVDLMGHAQTGGKALIFFIDGLYGGVHPIDSAPRKWSTAPFHGGWSSSLFASQDPVAIDSVGYDFLYAEYSEHSRIPGTEDYLHEAALANDPPSGTFYDPDHAENVTRLASLGVHEHWNNAQDKKYTRNLGKGRGLELVQIGPVE